MIGIWGASSNIFLVIIGVATLLFFGVPMTLVPMAWARTLRWELPQPRNLTLLLGRSLGIVISIIAVFAFRAAQVPGAKPFFFDLLLSIFGGMLLVHVYGALRKAQPITETVEILLWIVLTVVSLCFYPA